MIQPRFSGYRQVLLALLLVPLFYGCLGSSNSVRDPDEQFGHRVEGETPDGRTTIVIQAPDSDRTYQFFPATIQSVTVRPAPVETAADETGVSVEILVKGAFPDACTELHDVEQERTGNLIRVSLEMRRPAGAVCASVLRPYRFYLELQGTYAVGAYTLFLNDKPWPFEVHAAPGE
jgi:hypothetical protein